MEINPKKLFKDKFPTASVKLLVGSEAVQQELTEILEGVTAAEKTRAQNEEHRLRNEEIRDAFEMGRQHEEDERKEYEDDRREKESERQSEEQKRVLAEQQRVKNESDRGDAEYSRYLAEIDRVNAERLRDEAYKARVANDTLWDGRENKREARETERIQKEGVRESNETTRKDNENTRIINEAGRVSAEKNRVSAENARQVGYENWKEQVSEYSTRISNNAQEIRDVKEDLTTAPSLNGVNRYEKTVELISRSTNEVVYPITRPYAVVDENGKNLTTILDELSKSGGGIMEITYSDLKALRDSSSLTAGQFYRITDYVTTTKEVDTASANHPFDIIAFAIDSSHLCEECWAAVHEGDTYFANSALESWRVWYTLDNDTTRHGWADKTNGKGVIYRLIDNFGNDCPYDFKNIMFRRYYVSSGNFHSRFGDKYFGIKHLGMLFPDGSTIDQKDSDTSFFTFSRYIDYDQIDVPADLSLGKYAGSQVFGNIIKPLYDGRTQRLNNIVFAGSGCYGNVIGSNCRSMTFHRCCENSIGAECGAFCFDESNYNDIGGTCSGVDFAYSERNSVSHSNNYIAMSMSNHNVVGAFCESISFADNCASNRVGDNNHYVGFYGSNHNNSLGNHCWNVGFNPSSHYNHLGDMMIYVNISGEDNTLEGCSQWLNAGHEDDPCIGRWIRKYNSGVDTTGIRAGYFDGFEARVKLVYRDPECRIIGYDNESVTIEFSPWEVYDPAGTITDGVTSWLCTCYETGGGYLGYGEVEVQVNSNGRTNSFEIELPVEDLDGFMRNEEFELEITMVPVGDNGEWLYGYTPDGNPEEEIIYTYAYVSK